MGQEGGKVSGCAFLEAGRENKIPWSMNVGEERERDWEVKADSEVSACATGRREWPGTQTR